MSRKMSTYQAGSKGKFTALKERIVSWVNKPKHFHTMQLPHIPWLRAASSITSLFNSPSRSERGASLAPLSERHAQLHNEPSENPAVLWKSEDWLFDLYKLPTDGTTAFVKHASDEGIRIPDLSKIRKSPAKSTDLRQQAIARSEGCKNKMQMKSTLFITFTVGLDTDEEFGFTIIQRQSKIYVDTVDPNGQAAGWSLRPGDEIKRVNGVYLRGCTVEEASKYFFAHGTKYTTLLVFRLIENLYASGELVGQRSLPLPRRAIFKSTY